MSNYNSVTGDKLISKVNTKAYDENYDLIFNKEAKEEKPAEAMRQAPKVKYNFKETTDD